MFFFQFYFIVAVHRTVVSGGIYVHLSSPSTTNFIIIKETQCSESEKSRVPNIWFVWKNKDFLVAWVQELCIWSHQALLYLPESVFPDLLGHCISVTYILDQTLGIMRPWNGNGGFDRAIFVWPWKMVSVSVHYYCFISQNGWKDQNTDSLFSHKKTLIWRRLCLSGQSWCSMTWKQKVSIDF